MGAVSTELIQVLEGQTRFALLHGDSLRILSDFPESCIDCVITSPPYWQQREYEVDENEKDGLIGFEKTPQEYIEHLVNIFREIYRVLKPTGSLWLNLGDKYINKNLMGMPWRVALALQSEGWILRNDIIWEKMKGSQPVRDRLRNNHEYIFHFVKKRKGYYYDIDRIRIRSAYKPFVDDKHTVSATGVTGKKYRKQILESTELTEKERQAALRALDNVLQEIRDGLVVDFRMTIRGYQRTYHSNNGRISGRAKELAQKGFFIIKSYAKGYVPSDVWQIAPEDKVKGRSEVHYAVFPPELLEIPLKASCPPNGIVLDPFSGTGSTLIAALELGNRAIGIDISLKYIKLARERILKVLKYQRFNF